MRSEGFPDLPPVYLLDESDPDTLALRRPDGTVVVYFSAQGATREAIEEATWGYHKGTRKNQR